MGGNMFILSVLLLFTISCRLFIRYIKERQFSSRYRCGALPYVPQLETILGYQYYKQQVAATRDGQILAFFEDLFGKLGHTFKGTMWGVDQVLTSAPENFQQVLSLKMKDYDISARRIAFQPLLGASTFSLDGEAWLQSRALLQPTFNKKQLADLGTIEKHLQRFLEDLPKDKKTEIDVQPLLRRLTMNISTEFLFGHYFDTSAATETLESQKFSDDLDGALMLCQKRIRMGWGIYFHRTSELVALCSSVRQIVAKFATLALNKNQSCQSPTKTQGSRGITHSSDSSRHIFLDELVKRTSDTERITDNIIHLLLAGRDTTANTIGNALWLLARHKNVWNTLRTHVSYLRGELPTYKSLKQLDYARWVLLEALRLYPVVPNFGRVAVRDTILPVGGGEDGQSPVFIRKGSSVLLSPYAMHRRQDLYGEDVKDFRPERWETLSPRDWKYMPFSGGPRVCLGEEMALITASYVLVRIVQTFEDLETTDRQEFVPKILLTLSNRNGVKLSFTPLS